MMTDISIIVPCYNEQEALPLFYAEITRVAEQMAPLTFEFVFIDDGSSDGTLSALRSLAAQDKRVRFVSFSRNFGKEAAILAGLEAAEGAYIATMDADLQDPPALLPAVPAGKGNRRSVPFLPGCFINSSIRYLMRTL